MDLELKGRVALVTGASRGIGYGIAAELAREGASVAMVARGRDLEKSAEAIRQAGGDPFAIVADTDRPSEVDRAFRIIKKRFGGLDILVNNVGGPVAFKKFEELTDREWLATFQKNLFSAIRVTRAALPLLRSRPGARIVNIGSVAAIRMDLKFPDYRIAKAALIALSKYLALELAPDGIAVNTVCPGAVWTPSWDKEAKKRARAEKVSVGEMRRRMEREGSGSPLGRMGTVEEVARVVAVAASPRFGFLTGSTIVIDGGASLVL